MLKNSIGELKGAQVLNKFFFNDRDVNSTEFYSYESRLFWKKIMVISSRSFDSTDGAADTNHY